VIEQKSVRESKNAVGILSQGSAVGYPITADYPAITLPDGKPVRSVIEKVFELFSARTGQVLGTGFPRSYSCDWRYQVSV